MPLPEFPKTYDDIKELYESYAQLAKDNRRLKALVENGLAAKPKVPSKPSAGGSSSSNGWSTAPSVSDIEKLKHKSKPKPTHDSDDDTPLPRKGDAPVGGKGPKITGKKRPASDENDLPKPPRKCSAYNLFMGSRNHELNEHLKAKGIKVENNEDKSQLLGRIGKEWRELSESDRNAWQQKADAENADRLAAHEAKYGKGVGLEGSDDE